MEFAYVVCDCRLTCKTSESGLSPMDPSSGAAVTSSVGVFAGTEASALRFGWKVRDYGHSCPRCAAEEDRLAELGDVSVGLDQLEDALAADE